VTFESRSLGLLDSERELRHLKLTISATAQRERDQGFFALRREQIRIATRLATCIADVGFQVHLKSAEGGAEGEPRELGAFREQGLMRPFIRPRQGRRWETKNRGSLSGRGTAPREGEQRNCHL